MPLPSARPMGYAAFDLGLGDGLAAQVNAETEEERKRRLTRQQQLAVIGPAAMALGLNGTGPLGGY